MSRNSSFNGRDLLLAALRHEQTPSVPWVPYAGVHAGKLQGYRADEVLLDGDKLFKSLLTANEVYDPDGQPVVFDLQLEAEILGCDLFWSHNTPPSVSSHPLANHFSIPGRMPQKSEGRLPMVLKVMQAMKKEVGGHTALYGLVTGPLTLASHLRGTDIFMDMVRQPDKVKQLIEYTRQVAVKMAGYYIDAGMDVIAVVDPLVSQVSPKHFKQYLSDAYIEIFANITVQRAYSSFFVCGDATKSIEAMCQTMPDALAVDENINMLAAKQITDHYNITLCGNIPLTTKMLLGTQQDNMKFVVDMLDSIDHHNFILAPGCDMPYDTPVENVVGCLQAVRNPEQTREILKNYEAPQFNLAAIDIPDYASLSRPLIEVFTLDSASCAACTYMMRAVENAAAQFAGQVDVVEYKFTRAENVARVVKMGIKNLPTMFINGELKYSSIIPDQEELVAVIRAAMHNGWLPE